MATQNTGKKAWTTLQEYNTGTNQSTGTTKPNSPSDPDYVSPVVDTQSCPLPAGASYLFASPETINTGANPGAITINITSNSNWLVTNYNPAYITNTTFATGSGNGECSVIVSNNTSSTPRNFTFDVRTNDNSIIRMISVTQDVGANLTVSPSSKTIPASNATFQLNVTSSTAWDVSSNVNWLNVTHQSNYVLVSPFTNSGSSSRSGVITVETTSGEISKTIPITQTALSFYEQTVAKASTSSIACNAFMNSSNRYSIWSDQQRLINSSKLYTSSSGTFVALSGYYSDGMTWVRWSGTSIRSSGFCGF